MKIKCEYCEQMIEDTDPQCPYCGAVNNNVNRGASQVPTTIDELKSFCTAHNMPLEKMRFFIGEDYKGARAFGIFKDGSGDFVVYKNKDNGQRAVRYKGKDEAYAECICFLSDFHSPKKASGAWEKDKEYEDWQWWLARTEGGEWELVTWGY